MVEEISRTGGIGPIQPTPPDKLAAIKQQIQEVESLIQSIENHLPAIANQINIRGAR